MGWLGSATVTTPLQATTTGNCSPLRTSANRMSCRMLSRRKLRGGLGRGKSRAQGGLEAYHNNLSGRQGGS